MLLVVAVVLMLMLQRSERGACCDAPRRATTLLSCYTPQLRAVHATLVAS